MEVFSLLGNPDVWFGAPEKDVSGRLPKLVTKEKKINALRVTISSGLEIITVTETVDELVMY